jgi:hypothetical protein
VSLLLEKRRLEARSDFWSTGSDSDLCERVRRVFEKKKKKKKKKNYFNVEQVAINAIFNIGIAFCFSFHVVIVVVAVSRRSFGERAQRTTATEQASLRFEFGRIGNHSRRQHSHQCLLLPDERRTGTALCQHFS